MVLQGAAPRPVRGGRSVRGRADLRTLPPFRYHHIGDLAPIGRRAAVVNLGRIHLTGFLAWVFWSVVHIYFLIGTKYRFIVAFTWLWDYLTFQRGARLITDAPGGDETTRCRRGVGLNR